MFRIERLTASHDRKAFSSGVASLDRYLRELASQDVKRHVSNCFVALTDDDRIAGYYTLAATGVHLAELHAAVAKRLPRYQLLPAVLIGRLAVDSGFRGKGLGKALIADALARAADADPAIFAMLVDAKDEAALAFYKCLGFERLASRPMSLFMSVATATKLAGR